MPKFPSKAKRDEYRRELEAPPTRVKQDPAPLTPHEIGMAARRQAEAKYADRGLVAQALMAFYAYCDARRDAENAEA